MSLEQPDFESQFSTERSEWTERITQLSIRIRNIREISEVQVELYSDRQKLLEYTYKLGQILTRLNAKYRSDRKNRMIYYSEEHNTRYGANEKTTLLDGDLSEIKKRIEVVDNHMNFMNETVKTVDHFLFGIKTRIHLETFMRGGE